MSSLTAIRWSCASRYERL